MVDEIVRNLCVISCANLNLVNVYCAKNLLCSKISLKN